MSSSLPASAKDHLPIAAAPRPRAFATTRCWCPTHAHCACCLYWSSVPIAQANLCHGVLHASDKLGDQLPRFLSPAPAALHEGLAEGLPPMQAMNQHPPRVSSSRKNPSTTPASRSGIVLLAQPPNRARLRFERAHIACDKHRSTAYAVTCKPQRGMTIHRHPEKTGKTRSPETAKIKQISSTCSSWRSVEARESRILSTKHW